MPVLDGAVCHGATLVPAVRVNLDADVWLFSVAPDGVGTLEWPLQGDGANRVTAGQRRALPPLVAGWSGPASDRLVAVAVAAGGDPGVMATWRERCSVPGFGRAILPHGAAVAASTFSVRAPGRGGCQSAEVVWGDVPVCPNARTL